MDENENTIECIGRRYRVYTKGGMTLDVESSKKLSDKLNDALLKEDDAIKNFFSNNNIMNIRQVVMVPSNKPQERPFENKLTPKGGRFTPKQRLNHLLNMKGEFSRIDYQKYMFDIHGVVIERYTAYDDIRDAIASNRLKITEEKIGRARKYKVVDPINVDDNISETMINDRKAKLEILK